MRDNHTDGKLQIIAAMSLLDFSRLVLWDDGLGKFAAAHRDSFESSQREVNPVFGRLICWITFSAGAEYLAKGICLLNGVDIRNLNNGTISYGTLGNLYGERPPKDAFKQLCYKVHASQEEQQLLLAGC